MCNPKGPRQAIAAEGQRSSQRRQEQMFVRFQLGYCPMSMSTFLAADGLRVGSTRGSDSSAELAPPDSVAGSLGVTPRAEQRRADLDPVVLSNLLSRCSTGVRT